MDWVLPLHIAFIAVWFGSLVALPQLYAAHTATSEPDENMFYIALERWLYFGMMTPSGTLAIISGGWLIYSRGFEGGWLPVKLVFVSLMVFLHIYQSEINVKFEGGNNPGRPLLFHLLSLVTLLLALPVIVLVVSKPF